VTPPTPAPAPTDGGVPNWLRKLREGADKERRQPAAAPVAAIATPPPARAITVAPLATQEDYSDLPADADERLNLARTARGTGNLREAARIYGSLVSSGLYLDTVIADTQEALKTQSSYLLLQLMGDAMMREDRLQDALNAYRQALAQL
jgi:hypothetical protein